MLGLLEVDLGVLVELLLPAGLQFLGGNDEASRQPLVLPFH